MSNNIRVTLGCFLAYFVMSGMLSPIGIVLPPLAEYLGQPIEQVAPLFSWLTLGILMGSAFALVAFDLMSERLWLVLLYTLIVLALVLLRINSDLWALKLALGTVGVCCGVGLAAAASTITQLYDEDKRASMLVITDGSFSVAGIAISSLAVLLVAKNLHWSSSYLAVAAVAAFVVVLALTARFPAPAAVAVQHNTKSAWPLPVWLCIVALFLYTLGQYSLLWWLPSFLEAERGVSRADAGSVVARFWTGMFISQLFVAWWVLKIGARRLVLVSITGGLLGSIPLWTSTNTQWLPLLALLWGVVHLGLLKVVIAFATLSVPVPTPRLVAALLFGATSGTAISPAVTGAIAEAFSVLTVLQFGSLCYLVLGSLILVAWLLGRGGDERVEGASQ